MVKLTSGQKMSILRTMLGISRKRFCEYLNIQPSTLSNIENNGQNPSYEMLEKFFELFKIDQTHFFEKFPNMEEIKNYMTELSNIN